MKYENYDAAQMATQVPICARGQNSIYSNIPTVIIVYKYNGKTMYSIKSLQTAEKVENEK